MTGDWMGRQFYRFLLVGGAATALQYGLLVLQVEWLGWPVVASSSLAYLLSALCNYAANYHFTFASQARHQQALPRFFAIALAGLALNGALMALFVHGLQWHYLIGQVLATGLVLLWNFAANRRWTFG